MAYYTRKKGIDLWKPGEFTSYGFCLCCKRETAPEEKGLLSIKPNPRLTKNDPIERSVLCCDCLAEWKEKGYQPALCELDRFKIE